jgi:hypothetical protein
VPPPLLLNRKVPRFRPGVNPSVPAASRPLRGERRPCGPRAETVDPRGGPASQRGWSKSAATTPAGPRSSIAVPEGLVRGGRLVDDPLGFLGLPTGRSRRAPGGANDDAGLGANRDSLPGALVDRQAEPVLPVSARRPVSRGRCAGPRRPRLPATICTVPEGFGALQEAGRPPRSPAAAGVDPDVRRAARMWQSRATVGRQADLSLNRRSRRKAGHQDASAASVAASQRASATTSTLPALE